MSIFHDTEGLEEEDPIFGLSVAFRKDPRSEKINLAIGTYKTAEGSSLVLPSVREAERQLIEQQLDKEYLPIEGNADFLKQTIRLVLGENSPVIASERVSAVQTIGGTSALRLGAEYLALQSRREVAISEPSWSNHRSIVVRSQLTPQTYPYFEPATRALDFNGMCTAINGMKPGNVVLLHASCHNPTGIDPTFEQWSELSQLMKSRQLFPFFDLAYQGFGQGLDDDARAVRLFAEEGHELFVGCSYSKNFGLYGERVGALLAIGEHGALAQKALRQLKTLARASYSNPTLHGARLVANILQSAALRQQWMQELEQMRRRICDMRKALVDRLQTRLSRDLHFLQTQNGLFSFGLLQPEHVRKLKEVYAIYVLANGRINVAGLCPKNLDRVVDAVVTVLGQ